MHLKPRVARSRHRSSLLEPLESRVLMSTAPLNDDMSAAMAIPTVPYATSVDTTLATSAASDPTDFITSGHTVWFRYQPTKSTRVEVNTLGSQFDTILAVYTPQPGAQKFVAGDDDTTANGGLVQSQLYFNAVAGQTYYIMAGSYGSDAGGLMNIAVLAAPPLQMSVSLNDGVVATDGSLTISGTVNSNVPLIATFNGTATQIVGKQPTIYSVQGFTTLRVPGTISFSCTGTPLNGKTLGKGKIEVAGTVDLVILDPNGSIEEYTVTVRDTLKVRLG